MFSIGIQSLICLLLISGAQALGPAAIDLGTAGNFTILAQSGVSTVPDSVIAGNVGVSPASAAALTGFSLTLSPIGTSSASTQVIGNLFAADHTNPTPSQLIVAVLDLQTAFNNGTSRVLPDSLNLLAGGLTGQTLSPGLYKWTTSVTIGGSLTLNGSATDVWIFQIQNNLLYTAGAKTIFSGGALSKNVFWVVSGNVDLLAGSVLGGVILCATNVALVTGAAVNGRILAQTAVTLQKSTINPA